ncbi:MAG TPA: hypothetical protein VND23_01210 [Acidimicrobiales bacterium]|nr:hypothetical protein [Acidimicrobiales bacterium]
MPSDKTFVTELATALGMVGGGGVDEVIAARPEQFVNASARDWERLAELRDRGDLAPEFLGSYLNGQAFLHSSDALRGRTPRVIEWTGGRRPPGDEVVPADLRVDHVYLVSCKYVSRILHNPSPARLATGLLSHAPVDDLTDWFHRTAPVEYQALYDSCRAAVGDASLPERVADLTTAQRRALAAALHAKWPAGAAAAYAEMCATVAGRTAAEWRSRVSERNAELMLWRLLRIGSTPYFVLGSSASGVTRLRIDTPWDWRQHFVLRDLAIAAHAGGQALVSWSARYRDRSTGEPGTVDGHVEIRWSHGRFGQPPEAKVYLDSPIAAVPGYHEI